MNTKKKNLKPIDYDIHLKYLCPSCGFDHWLSINEAKTKLFKIVCGCGLVFGVKRVDSFKILYAKKLDKRSSKIPLDLLESAVKVLIGYGFTKSEASSIITDTYSTKPIDNLTLLIKQILKKLGENNGNSSC